ncbi:MAG: hypothetical protein WCD79_12315 [Chthoniobacteraceae bacterium]
MKMPSIQGNRHGEQSETWNPERGTAALGGYPTQSRIIHFIPFYKNPTNPIFMPSFTARQDKPRQGKPE